MTVKSGIAGQMGIAEELYVNAVQTISGTPSGTFGLNYDGALTTVTLTTTATAASIQTALNALPNLGNGLGTTAGVTVTGGPLPGAVTVTFSGTFVAGRAVPTLVVQGAVTGITITQATPGTGYGNAQTVTRFLEYPSETLTLQRDVIESSAIRTGSRLLRVDRQAVNRKGAGGDVNMEVSNTGFGLFFKHMWGASAITTPASGVLTRDHTYTIGDPTGKSLTVQMGRPDTVTGNVNPFTYKGCKVNGWELSQALDDQLMLKVTLDAQDEDQTISLAAASYPAAQAPFTSLQGQATIGGANVDVTALTLTYDPALNTARYFIRNNSLKKEPLPNALIAFTGNITMEFSDLVTYSRFTSGTPAAVTMTWVGSLIETVAGPISYFYTVQVTLPQVRFDGATPTVSGFDVVSMSMPIKVLWDGTTSPSLLYRTTDTTD